MRQKKQESGVYAAVKTLDSFIFTGFALVTCIMLAFLSYTYMMSSY